MTYWYTVTHYATGEVMRAGHHVTLEMILEECKRSLAEFYMFECGLD